MPPVQLYDLEADPRETTNIHQQHPEVVTRLTKLLRRYVENGRSTPGPVQPNHDNKIHWGQLPWQP